MKIRGIQPLIFNSGAQINPLSPLAKQRKKITSKRAKTDDDHFELFRLDMLGTAYWDDDGGGLYMPSENIQACFHGAAKKRKLGRQAIGFLPDSPMNGLGFKVEGSPDYRSKDKFFSNEKYMFVKNVKVGTSSIMKCRARIPAGWGITITGMVDDSLLDLEQVEELWEIAGHVIGLGDWRPSSPKSPGRNGMFEVESFTLDKHE